MSPSTRVWARLLQVHRGPVARLVAPNLVSQKLSMNCPVSGAPPARLHMVSNPTGVASPPWVDPTVQMATMAPLLKSQGLDRVRSGYGGTVVEGGQSMFKCPPCSYAFTWGRFYSALHPFLTAQADSVHVMKCHVNAAHNYQPPQGALVKGIVQHRKIQGAWSCGAAKQATGPMPGRQGHGGGRCNGLSSRSGRGQRATSNCNSREEAKQGSGQGQAILHECAPVVGRPSQRLSAPGRSAY